VASHPRGRSQGSASERRAAIHKSFARSPRLSERKILAAPSTSPWRSWTAAAEKKPMRLGCGCGPSRDTRRWSAHADVPAKVVLKLSVASPAATLTTCDNASLWDSCCRNGAADLAHAARGNRRQSLGVAGFSTNVMGAPFCSTKTFIRNRCPSAATTYSCLLPLVRVLEMRVTNSAVGEDGSFHRL
jgi:hypothetical protein